MQPGPECTTRRILKERYHADFKVYLEATRSLESTVNTPAFRETYERVTRSQKVFEHSKTELERHYQEHGCGELGE